MRVHDLDLATRTQLWAEQGVPVKHLSEVFLYFWQR